MLGGRRKLPGRVLVIPYGTGIGDMVNMRPLLSAVAVAYAGDRVSALVGESLQWLLPEGIDATPSVHGVRPWQRFRADSGVARALGSLSVAGAARTMRPMVSARTVRLMTAYLRMQEYPVVINLLEALTDLDGPERRSTAGGDTSTPNVVDVVAAALEGRGIPVPRHRRTPSIDVPPIALGGGRTALLAVHAGSTLKEAPALLWREVARGLADRGFRPYVVVAPGREPDPGLMAAPSVEPLMASLPDLTRVIAGATVVVGVDTGVLHLAAATGTRYVGLFGATDPGFSGPYNRALGITLSSPFDHPPVCGNCWAAQMLPACRCPLFAPTTCLSTLAATDVCAAVDAVTGCA